MNTHPLLNHPSVDKKKEKIDEMRCALVRHPWPTCDSQMPDHAARTVVPCQSEWRSLRHREWRQKDRTQLILMMKISQHWRPGIERCSDPRDVSDHCIAACSKIHGINMNSLVVGSDWTAWMAASRSWRRIRWDVQSWPHRTDPHERSQAIAISDCCSRVPRDYMSARDTRMLHGGPRTRALYLCPLSRRLMSRRQTSFIYGCCKTSLFLTSSPLVTMAQVSTHVLHATTCKPTCPCPSFDISRGSKWSQNYFLIMMHAVSIS